MKLTIISSATVVLPEISENKCFPLNGLEIAGATCTEVVADGSQVAADCKDVVEHCTEDDEFVPSKSFSGGLRLNFIATL